VPRLDRTGAVLGAEPDQNGSSNQVAHEGQQSSGNDQDETSRGSERIKFTQKQRYHQRGLKRPNPTAGFFDADQAGTHFDHVSMLKRWNTGDAEKKHINRSYRSHQILNDGLFELNRPRNRHEKETNRESEVAEPCSAAELVDKSE
jgi:hypothetical protein